MTCVMAFHFIPWVERYLPLGSIGVRLFFALSGFLITRILLASRDQEMTSALRSFYIRRSLRIFPVYYLVLLLGWVMAIGPVRVTIGWHVPYLTNVYLFDRGAWHGSISHLWSLAVEEQFYLVWPWLVLSVPVRRLPWLIATMICLAPLSRLLIGGPMSAVLPTSCLDSLGAGALLALPQSRSVMMRVGAVAGLPILGASLGLRYAGAAWLPLEAALDFGVALTAAWIVGTVSAPESSVRFLERRPLVYLGTISYGVYLFHGFVPYVLGRYVAGLWEMPWPATFVLLSSVTITAASMSWFLFEAPILGYKERFGPAGQRASGPAG